MSYWVFIGMSFSICITAIIAALRFRQMDTRYLPFILCIWIASLNEITSFTLAQSGYSNIPNNNIYILLEGMLVLWQFKRWNLFNRAGRLYRALAILLPATWLYEIHSWSSLQELHYYYRLLCAIMIVICSININSRLMISHHKSLITNPAFIVCTGYILYFTLKILTDTYWLYKPASSTAFLTAVFYSIAFNNLLTNLIFTIAVLWIRRKPDYIIF